MTAVDEKYPGVLRQRDRLLIDALLQAAAKRGGELTEEAAFEAVSAVHQRSVSAKWAAKIVKRKLANPNIRDALAGVFSELADFSIADAVKMHVEHIKGIPYQAVTKAGDVVQLRDKPSYAALKDFEAMTMPLPAKKVEVGMTVGMVGRSMLEHVPAIEPRALGPAIVENVVDQTVELVDEDADGD